MDSGSESEDDFDFGGDDYRKPAPGEKAVVRAGDYNEEDCSSDEEEIRNRWTIQSI